MAKYSIHYYRQNIHGKLHKLLATICLKVWKIKSNILPFGGINIIFMGNCYNFCQSMTHHYIRQTCNQFLHSQNNTKKVVGKLPLGKLHLTK
jgi:hypothetical protein